MEESDEVVDVLREWTKVFMHRSMSGFVLFAKEHRLSMSQVGALFQLSHRGISGVSGIGDNLGVTSAAASQMIDRLVRQGFIVRSEDPNDRRAKQIALTRRGRQFIRDTMKARKQWFESLANGMSMKERKTVVAGLQILIKKTAKMDPDIRPFNPPAGNMEDTQQ